jgi:hypothetical protein
MKSPFRISVFFRENIDKSPTVTKKPKENINLISNPEKAKEELNADILETYSNAEFLNIARESRLQHITKPSKKSDNLKD